MRLHITASALQRVASCPASASLPRREESSPAALAGVAAHAALEAECPADERAEVAYAYNVTTGEARELPKQEHRAYPDLGAGWIFGTADRVAVVGDTVRVLDHKTGGGGRFHTTPARDNLQLRFLVLAAATVDGFERAEAVLDFHDGGPLDVQSYDALDLAAAAAEMRAIYERAAAPSPGLAEGAWCRYCPCAWRCPAKRDVATALASADPKLPTLELTPEAVAVGWARLKALKALLGDVERAYRSFAASTPVPLANGKTLGEVESTRESVDGQTAFLALAEAHGHEVAMQACEFKASKASIERAVKPLAEKGKGAALVRETLAKIAAKGGITTKTTRSVEEY